MNLLNLLNAAPRGILMYAVLPHSSISLQTLSMRAVYKLWEEEEYKRSMSSNSVTPPPPAAAAAGLGPRALRRRISDGMAPAEDLASTVRSPSLNDQNAEVQKLMKTNFDLRLRIFYLEEQRAKRHGGDDSRAALEEEMFQQKLLIEEREKELEDRNMLLIKSRNAIESLQADLELMRARCGELQDSQVSAVQLESTERQLDMQSTRINQLELEVSRYKQEDANAEKVNASIRSQLEEARSELKTKDKNLAAVRNELAEQARAVTRLSGELEVARPQVGMQAELAQSLEKSEREVAALNERLDEARDREMALQADLQESVRREKEQASKAADVARMEADEIARLHRELEQSRQKRAESDKRITKLMREGDDRRGLLADAVNALKQLEKTHGATVAELNVARENRLARDEELRADAARIAADAEVKHNALVSELRQKLMSSENKLAQSEFAREQAQKTLVAETEELERSRRLCAEMQKRVLEADESRRSDENTRTLLLDREIRARAEAEASLKEAEEAIHVLRIEAERSKHSIAESSHSRERKIMAEAQSFVDMVEAQLTECIDVPQSPHVESTSDRTVADSNAGASSAQLLLRRELARLDKSSTGQDRKLSVATDLMFPRRSILQKLLKLQNMRSAFQRVVANAEKKYTGRVEALERSLANKCQALDDALAKQRSLITKINEASNLKNSLRHSAIEISETKREAEKLEGELQLSRKKEKEALDELESQRRANRDLSAQLQKAGNMVESLKEAQAGLHRRMQERESEIAQHTAALKRTSDIHSLRSSGPESGYDAESIEQSPAPLKNTLREHIQDQVRRTQHDIDHAIADLEVERSRYLSTADLNASHPLGASSASRTSNNARKVKIHRSGSVDIRFHENLQTQNERRNVSKHAMSTPDARAPHSISTPAVSTQHMADLRLLQDELVGKQAGLESLLMNIRNLVGSTERFLDNFFEMKDRSSGSENMKENDAKMVSSATSILQRDVMTLLDSNARLALQLQALGKDLQTVYRRFKTLETSLSSYARPKLGIYSVNHKRMGNTPVAADVEPIILQMQKWGRDLQSAAETLGASRA